jgi:crossover junction endodeoxyribonuclease RusA
LDVPARALDLREVESEMNIILPWPPKELSPNARQHHMAHYRAKKSYRAVCFWQAKQQGVKTVNAEALHLTLTFYAPTRRAFDLDNALARIKSGLDGLADVLGVDDSRWALTIKKGDTVGGFVRVEVSE